MLSKDNIKPIKHKEEEAPKKKYMGIISRSVKIIVMNFLLKSKSNMLMRINMINGRFKSTSILNEDLNVTLLIV
ncbi:MAG: hypothetical protein QXZ54_06100 [Candidatus Methanomethylicia archaeon]